jgi:hypothetical protein
VTGNLICDHVYPDMNWDVVPSPGDRVLFIRARVATAGVGSETPLSTANTPILGFEIVTPGRMAPLTETCATLPPPPPGLLKPSFVGSYLGWSAACSGPSPMVLPGTSFEVVIESVGTLTSDSAGANPLDAGPDAIDWANLKQEVLSNSFHGTLTSTLVGADGGSPIYVKMTF